MALGRPVTIIVIGGSAAALKYRIDDPTTDIDTFNSLGADLRRAIDSARRATGLPMPFEQSGVADGPYDFEDRLLRAMPSLTRLTVLVPERHDLALMKTVRGDQADFAKVRPIHARNPLDLSVLLHRYEALMRKRISTWTGTPLVAAFLLLGAGLADFEPPATFRASEILPAELLRGPHHTVSEAVKADGFYQEFHLASDFGELEAEGRAVLETRVAEFGALARLSEVSKGEVFAKAAGGAVLNIGKGVVSAVQDPGATIKGIGGGLKRFGVNLGRKAKRAADSLAKDDKKPDGPEQPEKDRALNAAGGAAKSVLGVNGAARRWARKLGVDPYTTNPVLHEALVDVGKIDRAGSIAATIVMPIPMVVSTTATVGGLVWNADPEEVRKTNERRLGELGASKDVAARYLINGNYTLTSQTRFIAALHAVRVGGCPEYVDAASEAEDERDALFFVESAELLAELHRSQPLTAILPDSRAMVARRGTTAMALLPFDWVRWTEALQKESIEIASRARRELGARSLEVRISGTATPAARAGLSEAGWVVKDRVPTAAPALQREPGGGNGSGTLFRTGGTVFR